MRAVAVTGLGVVSPLGNSVAALFDSLCAGRSGIRAIAAPLGDRLAYNAVGVVDIDFAAHLPKAMTVGPDRFSLMALVAARQAVADAGLTPQQLDDAGVYVGTGIGGVQTLEHSYEDLYGRNNDRIKPFTVIHAMNNAAAAHIAIDHRCHGPSMTFSTACSSSALAIGEAMRLIRHGGAERVIVGGSEAMLTLGAIKAWEALRTLAIPDPGNPATASRPFSKDRTGLVLSEGSAMLVLESLAAAEARGATIHALLSGYGARTDASHMTKPDANGQMAAMRAALADAGLSPDDIGYINAHGTATVAGDVIESNAIKGVFGARAARIPVSSTKSMHGHLMGATGALELMIAVLALKSGVVPPTINLRVPDPECDLDYVPNVARHGVALRHVMSNSFAFGGSNAVLIASRR